VRVVLTYNAAAYKISPKSSNPMLSYNDLKFEMWGRPPSFI